MRGVFGKWCFCFWCFDYIWYPGRGWMVGMNEKRHIRCHVIVSVKIWKDIRFRLWKDVLYIACPTWDGHRRVPSVKVISWLVLTSHTVLSCDRECPNCTWICDYCVSVVVWLSRREHIWAWEAIAICYHWDVSVLSICEYLKIACVLCSSVLL